MLSFLESTFNKGIYCSFSLFEGFYNEPPNAYLFILKPWRRTYGLQYFSRLRVAKDIAYNSYLIPSIPPTHGHSFSFQVELKKQYSWFTKYSTITHLKSSMTWKWNSRKHLIPLHWTPANLASLIFMPITSKEWDDFHLWTSSLANLVVLQVSVKISGQTEIHLHGVSRHWKTEDQNTFLRLNHQKCPKNIT